MLRLLLLIPFVVALSLQSLADEGMWIPLLLKGKTEADMQKKGFKLTAEDLYSINHASLKDAIVIFGRGCTGELVSDEGLLFTNHHCGYGNIQALSSIDKDYLTNGFWAMNRDEELACQGLTVSFLVRMEDVTARVNKSLTASMTEAERAEEIAKVSAEIENEAKKDNNYTAIVKSFYEGNEFYLIVNEVFTDVRLVGTPPSAIGKFGGDTDNWMWPRHTGDFSVFRIYANKDNKPAAYAQTNVPYKPKKHLAISMKGVKKDDFTMVFGYPGTTREYQPSYTLQQLMEIENPAKILIRQKKLDVLAQYMTANAETRIKYSNKQAGIANAWKKWMGEVAGLRKMDAVAKKQNLEKEFTAWVNASAENKKKYGTLLDEYKKVYESWSPYVNALNYTSEAVTSLDIIRFASRFKNLANPMGGNTDRDLKIAAGDIKAFFKDFDLQTDRALTNTVLQIYYDSIKNPDFRPNTFHAIETQMMGQVSMHFEQAYEKSIFVNPVRLQKMLDNYTPAYADTIAQDYFYTLWREVTTLKESNIAPQYNDALIKLDSLDRIYMQALREFRPSQNFYPDANFTMRLTYGKVADYNPRDGVKYDFQTTLDGAIEKDNPEIYDYNLPTKLKSLYAAKDYGQYGEKGKMPVCFIASNHTSGGNSGSPVLNGKGELIGINFDRDWEGTMSDYMYNPDQCRNISLDIRYVLFIIDKYAGASHLIKEMTLVAK